MNNSRLMNKKTILMTMLMLIGFGIAQAEDDVIEIGDNGTTTLFDIPTSSLYKYSLTQQIFTKSELGTAKNLNSVSFFNAAKEKTRNLNIYLVHTRKTEFSITDVENNKSNDWVSFSETNRVFSGDVSFFEDDWATITFSKSFRYNGTDNLVLIVDDNSGTWSGGLACRVFSAQSQTLRFYSDNTNCNPSGLSDYAGSIINAKNQIKFNAVDDSPARPTSISVSNISSSSAIVEWQGAGSKWNMQYRCSSDSKWTTLNNLTMKRFKLTDLTPGKDYRVRVQTVYDEGKLSKWISTDFTTQDQYLRPTGLTVIGFDAHSAILKWQDNCGAKAWKINLISLDGTDKVIDAPANPFTLTGLASGTSYRIRVCAVIGEEVSKWSDYAYVTTLVVNSMPIDVIASPTPNSATISWAGTSDSYEVRYRKAESEAEWTSLTTTATEVTLTGLESNTAYEYQVVGRMSGEPDNASDIAVFTTLPDNPIPTDLAVSPTPTSATITWTGYSDSYNVKYRTASQELFFDDFKDGLDKWTIYTEGEAPYENGWYPYYDIYSGMSAACARSWENNISYNSDNWLVTPQLTLQGTLKFKEYTYGKDPESYEVLLSTTGNAIEDFTERLRPMQKATDEWSEVSIDLSRYAGQEGYIAIHHVSTGCSFLIIDDFGIFGAASEQGEWITETTNKSSITISGLERNTKYDYQVVGLKVGQLSAATSIASFTTPDDIIDIVFQNDGNNEGAIVSNSGRYANVTLMGRTFKNDGTWQTICLPFDLAIKGSVLEGAQVRTLESATLKESVIILNCLKPVTKLTAGTPYIIKWDRGADIVDPVFNEVIIKDTENTIQVYNKKVGFTGIYQSVTSILTNSNYYYLDDSPILVRFGYGSELHAFDACFGFDSSLIDDKTVIVLNTGNEDELITGLDEYERVKGSESEIVIYDLAGRKISAGAYSSFKKGINIVNGKKVLIK